MPLTAYRLLAHTVHRLPLPPGRLATALAGRRAAAARWERWARSRPAGRTTRLWLHAASLGEALAARPVVERLRAERPHLEVVLTHTSPSLAGWPGPLGVAAMNYLPLDEPRPVATALDALRPALLVFSRGDLWPELVLAAHGRGIPVAVLGATVRPGSFRLTPLARVCYRRFTSGVTWLGAVSPAHAARWRALGVPAAAIEVTGDPRHDLLLERVPDPSVVAPLRAWAGRDALLVAGSTHVEDERVLLAALAALLREGVTARLLFVPHDPERDTAARIARRGARLGIAVRAWQPGAPAPSARALVVTRRGILADLYAAGTVAYVGGGFGRRGLHAVAEPAALGVPVIVGPHHRGDDDAAALLAAGGARPLPAGRSAPAALVTQWRRWGEGQAERRAAGAAARAALHRGAAARTTRALAALLPPAVRA